MYPMASSRRLPRNRYDKLEIEACKLADRVRHNPCNSQSTISRGRFTCVVVMHRKCVQPFRFHRRFRCGSCRCGLAALVESSRGPSRGGSRESAGIAGSQELLYLRRGLALSSGRPSSHPQAKIFGKDTSKYTPAKNSSCGHLDCVEGVCVVNLSRGETYLELCVSASHRGQSPPPPPQKNAY